MGATVVQVSAHVAGLHPEQIITVDPDTDVLAALLIATRYLVVIPDATPSPIISLPWQLVFAPPEGNRGVTFEQLADAVATSTTGALASIMDQITAAVWQAQTAQQKADLASAAVANVPSRADVAAARTGAVADSLVAVGGRYDSGQVLASDARATGGLVWPTTTNADITAHLKAACTYAWDNGGGGSRPREVVVPAGTWTISDEIYRGTANGVAIRGSSRGSVYLNVTAAGPIINSVSNMQRFSMRDLSFNGSGDLVRMAFTGASSQAGSYRRIDNVLVDGLRPGSTAFVFAASDQALFYVTALRVSADVTTAPPNYPDNLGTCGLAIDGLMESSRIEIATNRLRVPWKFGHSAQNSKIETAHTWDTGTTRTYWTCNGWFVPEQNGPTGVDGRGGGHAGGTVDCSKLGLERMLPAVDYRFMCAEPLGTLTSTAANGALLVEVKTSYTVPTPDWTVDCVVSGGTFQLVSRRGGLVQESSPQFARLSEADAWSTATSTTMRVVDLTKGTSGTALPDPQTGVPISEFGKAMPMRAPSNAWTIGVALNGAKVANNSTVRNPPLLSLWTAPSQTIGCRMTDTLILDTSGVQSGPNFPSYMAKFEAVTTAPAMLGRNAIRGSITATDRVDPAAPNAPQIPACNVPGVFTVDIDSTPHIGVPTVTLNAGGAAGTGAGAPTLTAKSDDRVMEVSWKTGTAAVTVGAHVDVMFAQPYAVPPQVQVTGTSNNQPCYATGVTTTGFSIGQGVSASAGKNVSVLCTVYPRDVR